MLLAVLGRAMKLYQSYVYMNAPNSIKQGHKVMTKLYGCESIEELHLNASSYIG